MATYTSYLNLEKPATSENFNLSKINSNWDKIDSGCSAINSKIASYDIGMDSSLPSTIPNGVVGFGLSSEVTIGTTTIPAGTRIFGYVQASIGHFVAIPNSTSIYILRKDSNGWTVRATK